MPWHPEHSIGVPCGEIDAWRVVEVLAFVICDVSRFAVGYYPIVDGAEKCLSVSRITLALKDVEFAGFGRV